MIIALPFLSLHGQAGIILDEHFSDWDQFEPVYSDAAGDAGPGRVDFGRLWVANDDRYLYMRIEMGAEINFQSNNDLVLYLDIDDDQSTGFPTQGIGADIRYFPGLRFGFGSVSGFEFEIRHPDIGLISSPTVTGDQFEIALTRQMVVNGTPVETGDRIRIAWGDDIPGGDRLPGVSGGIMYQMQDGMISLPESGFARADPQDLRILSWNALQDGMFQPGRAASFRRLLQAMEPDVIGFQEIYDHSAAQVLDFVAAALPGGDWYAARQGPDIFVVSRYPVEQSQALSGNGAFLLDLGERKLLVVNAHLPCCENEFQRQQEADQIMGFIRTIRDGSANMQVPPGTPVVVLGDMNLVGLRRQQETLITGDILNETLFGPDVSPDWDDTDFEDALPLATGLPAAVTWIQPFSSFSPGRLDYILYSGSVMRLQKTFGINTATMTSGELVMYALFDFDTFNASDHLPCVADFSFDLQTSVSDGAGSQPAAVVYPNPASHVVYLEAGSGEIDPGDISILDLSGNRHPVSVIAEGVDGQRMRITVSSLPAGFYILEAGTLKYPLVKH